MSSLKLLAYNVMIYQKWRPVSTQVEIITINSNEKNLIIPHSAVFLVLIASHAHIPFSLTASWRIIITVIFLQN